MKIWLFSGRREAYQALAIRNRGYINQVRLRGLQDLKPAQAGFVCVAAISIAKLLAPFNLVKRFTQFLKRAAKNLD